jgi:hypothetical protein
MFPRANAPKPFPKQTQLSFLQNNLLLRPNHSKNLPTQPIHQLMLMEEMEATTQQIQILHPKDDFKNLIRQSLLQPGCPHLGLSLPRLSL